MCMWVAQSCPTLCNPMDCSPPGSSVHEIIQARVLEWVAIPFSRGSSQTRHQTLVFCIAERFFTIWATGEAHIKAESSILFLLARWFYPAVYSAALTFHFFFLIFLSALLLTSYRGARTFNVMFFCLVLHIMTFDIWPPITVCSMRVSLHGTQFH